MGSAIQGKMHRSEGNSVDICSRTEIIVDGFTRRIHKPSSGWIIPQDINYLVHQYYISNALLFLIGIQNDIYLSNFITKTHMIHNARPIWTKQQITDKHYMDSSICMRDINKNNHIIYECGGLEYTDTYWVYGDATDSCASITLNSSATEISSIDKLPNLPHGIAGNCTLYDDHDQYGLLSIGGYTKHKLFQCIWS